jgi:hypothetical protein
MTDMKASNTETLMMNGFWQSKGETKMKNSICKILYTLLIVGLPLIFAINGYGLGTWQWWAVLFGIFVSHILGMLRMEDFE